MKEYEDLEIVVERISGVEIYAVNVRGACDGKEGDGSSSFQLNEITSPLVAGAGNEGANTRHIKIASSDKEYTVFGEKPLSRKDAESVGVQLSNALFKGEILQLWGQCKKYPSLRIRLDLSSAPDLAALPWEYMRTPGNTNFIGLDDRTTFLRYLRTTDAIRPLKVIPPLRILVMASSPTEVRQLDTKGEITKIKDALGSISEQNIEIVVLEKATIDALAAALQAAREDDKPFHIFHYIGHGAFDEAKNEGILLFEDDSMNSVAVGHEKLAQVLQPYRSDLRLIVLNACETARHSANSVYASVAAKVMQVAEIPAAIAMRYEITDKAAITFAEAFYKEMASGEPIEQAVDFGRMEVNRLNRPDEEWATPILYLRARNGNLFDVKVPEAPEELKGHYQKLASLLPSCNLVIFLGLDVNLSDRPYYDKWKPGIGLPSMGELYSYLSSSFDVVPAGGSLASLAQRLMNRGAFPDEMERIFAQPSRSTRLYRTLGQLTRKVTDKLPDVPADVCHSAMLFVTTTYDRALEQAFVEAGISEYHTIRYEQGFDGNWQFTHRRYADGKSTPIASVPLVAPHNPNTYGGLRGKWPVILKLPGEISNDESRYAITEDDFFAFAHKGLSDLLPADLLTQIQTCRHLYLGYDLQNWTLRLLWSRLCENQRVDFRKKSYAVVFDDKADPNADFWRENNVTFAAAELDDYISGLEQYVLGAFH